MEGSLRGPQLLAKLSEGSSVLIVPVHITKKICEKLERIGIDAPMIFQAVLGTVLQILQAPPGLGHTDDGDTHSLIANQPQQRGKNLFVSEIATRSEKNDCVR